MQILFGLLPLVAFYVGESWGGLKVGILAACACSLVDLAHGVWSRGRVNRLVLLSTVLVVVLGGMSLLSDDERFVLWTPVLGDLVFAALLLASLFGPRSALELAMEESQPDAPIDHVTRAFLRGITGRFAVNLLVHAVVTAWATTQSRETWLFVSGPVQYLLMAAQLPIEFVLARKLPPLEQSPEE